MRKVALKAFGDFGRGIAEAVFVVEFNGKAPYAESHVHAWLMRESSCAADEHDRADGSGANRLSAA